MSFAFSELLDIGTKTYLHKFLDGGDEGDEGDGADDGGGGGKMNTHIILI